MCESNNALTYILNDKLAKFEVRKSWGKSIMTRDEKELIGMNVSEP